MTKYTDDEVEKKFNDQKKGSVVLDTKISCDLAGILNDHMLAGGKFNNMSMEIARRNHMTECSNCQTLYSEKLQKADFLG